jgi:5-formyltetrahydrofolate cyclo-ligase
MKDTTDKNDLRSIIRARRNAFVEGLSEQDKSLSFSAVPSPLKSLLSSDKSVAAYVPIGSEADPMALLRYAHDAGCKTSLPHVTSKISPMRFLLWQPDEPLEQGPFQLLQPNAENSEVTPDIILVPLVAFDRTLARLGQGAGHYDRALSILGSAYTIGIAWSVQEVDLVPIDPWDIPLDAILTEKEWITQ